MGRPSKAAREAKVAADALLTREKAQRDSVIRLMRLGRSRQVAAAAIGVHRTTLARWAEREPEFGEQLARAEAEFIGAMTDVVIKAATSNPQAWPAAMTLLERRFPDQFGQRVRLDITTDVRAAVEEDAAELGVNPDVITDTRTQRGPWRSLAGQSA